MEILYAGAEVRRLKHRQAGSVGFVPTMGALHAGHLALVQAAGSSNDLVVCSIFVNPVQFNNSEDLAAYPRTLEADFALLESVGCDAVFVPSVEEMYPAPPDLRFDFGRLETVMEGAFRPGHFNGVGVVVSKLFNIVQPEVAYFGQKDLQQTAIIKSLVRNLSYPVKLEICPTIREADGLAMSSRNTRLSKEDRNRAPQLYRILTECRERLEKGEEVKSALEGALTEFGKLSAFNVEYLELVDADTLVSLDVLRQKGENALCVAAYLGGVRLIDNLVF